VCDVSGDVFKAIENTSAEWMEYFEDNPDATEFVVTIGEKSYVVRRYQEVNGFLISTNEGHGTDRTMPGLAGYYYSQSGNARSLVFGYSDELVRGNIYCYQRT
jgi:hypothetical protein